jgi:hypothetical protein
MGGYDWVQGYNSAKDQARDMNLVKKIEQKISYPIVGITYNYLFGII